MAAIWVSKWKSVRKLNEGETKNDFYGILITEPNKEIGAIHPKAMPETYSKQEEWETWLCTYWVMGSKL